MHTNDGKYFKLKALGYGGESLPDLTKEWLIDLGATGTSIPDLERSYLAAQGLSGSIPDMWFTWLGTQGATGGSLADRWHDYWTTGTFTQTISVDGDDAWVSDAGYNESGSWGSVIYLGQFANAAFADGYAMFSFSTGGLIPRAAVVDSATITVDLAGVVGSDINFSVGCQVIGSAAQPSASNNPNDSTWTMTTAKTVRTDVPSNGLVSIDIKSAIQEIVNQTTWDKGRINVFVEDNHGSAANNYWTVGDEAGSATPSKLVVNWEK